MLPVVLFGEAERGEFCRGYLCHTLGELLDQLGQPPPFSRGLYYAIQALLYRYELLFFRVQEEGYSYQDYVRGFRMLGQQDVQGGISAVCMPGVGDSAILDAIYPICLKFSCVLITNEADLYDYLMIL